MSKDKSSELASITTKGVILGALIGALATVITALLAFPPFQDWVRTWGKPLESQQEIAIEQIPLDIFAYAGNNNPDGGTATFVLIVDDANTQNYKLDYSLLGDKYGFAGLAFNLHESMNLSAYNVIECILIFSQPPDEINLYIKDIGKNFNTIRVVSNGSGEMALRYEFRNFPDINFNAVKEVGIVASTDFSTGTHQVVIKNIKFVK